MYQLEPEEQNDMPESIPTPETQPNEDDPTVDAAPEGEIPVEPETAPDEIEMPNEKPASETEEKSETEAADETVESTEEETLAEETVEEISEPAGKKTTEDEEETTEEPAEKAISEDKLEKPTEPTIEETTPEKSEPVEEYFAPAKTPIISEGDIPETDEEVGDYSAEERRAMLERMEETMTSLKDHEIIKGKILHIGKDDVVVDIGFKSEGIVPKEEFPEGIEEGQEVDVYLEQLENENGQVVISKQKADFIRVWQQIREAFEEETLITGTIKKRIKGGMVVDIMGVEAFLPGSQIALHQVPDFDALIGEQMDFRVIKLNKIRKNIVVSRRVVLEEKRDAKRQELLEEIEEGQVREGTVKNITDFGVFIDLGGLDGLLHITDMSWSRIKHPSEMVKIGDKLDVKILKFDEDKKRISLGLKQLTESPWERVEEKYPENARIRGKVVNITKYGAFVELEEGVEGLIHVSEMSWTKHINHPSEILNIGDEIDIIVLNVDKENQKISLGIKQLEPDPWTILAAKYPPGSRIKGKVRNLTSFGAFIEIEDNIDGLVHISDMSWTKRIMHPSEIMRKGDEIEVVVLNIDPDNRRVSLGIKQLEKDPWPELSDRFFVGRETEGRITRMTDRGVTVKLPDDVEGFVPVTQLGKEVNRPHDAFSEGDLLPLRVVEFDRNERKIVLSVNSYFEGREASDLDRYLAAHPTKTVTIGEAIGEAFTPIPPVPVVETEAEKPPVEEPTPEGPDTEAIAEAEPEEEEPVEEPIEEVETKTEPEFEQTVETEAEKPPVEEPTPEEPDIETIAEAEPEEEEPVEEPIEETEAGNLEEGQNSKPEGD